MFLDTPSICGKWLQQITELVPNLQKLSVMWDSGTGSYRRDAFLAAAAKAFSLERKVIAFRGGGPIDSVLEAELMRYVQALVPLGSPA